MIGSQPAIFAAIRPDSPTAPTPNTANESPGLRLHRVEHRARAGLAAAGERSEQLERRVVAHLHDEALVGDGVGRERRLLEERAVDRRAVLAHQRRAVGAGAAHLQVEALSWQCDAMSRRQFGAGAAPGKRDDDVIAWREAASTALPTACHDAGALVAEHGGEGVL